MQKWKRSKSISKFWAFAKNVYSVGGVLSNLGLLYSCIKSFYNSFLMHVFADKNLFLFSAILYGKFNGNTMKILHRTLFSIHRYILYFQVWWFKMIFCNIFFNYKIRNKVTKIGVRLYFISEGQKMFHHSSYWFKSSISLFMNSNFNQ